MRIEQGSTINAISTDGIVLGDNVKIGKIINYLLQEVCKK